MPPSAEGEELDGEYKGHKAGGSQACEGPAGHAGGMWHACQDLLNWLLTAQSGPLVKVGFSFSADVRRLAQVGGQRGQDDAGTM